MNETGKHADRIHDVLLVGAGPIGLEMAAALKGAGVDYVHLERGQVGETISHFPLQMRWFSSNDRIGIAGLPLQTGDQNKASREEYLAYLRQVVRHFDLRVRSYEPVSGVEQEEGHILVRSTPSSGERLTRARRLILAIGGTHRPRRMGIPGEELSHVDHSFVEPHRYFGRKLLVIGGRNSAVEAALRCWHAGAEVALSYRREAIDPDHVKYWLLPELRGRLLRKEIEGHLETTPVSIAPDSVRLRRADGSEYDVAADFVLPLIGFTADHSLFDMLELDRVGEESAPLLDPDTMESSVPGVHVIGTAVAGEQHQFAVFMENCHVHVDRVMAVIRGTAAPEAPASDPMPES